MTTATRDSSRGARDGLSDARFGWWASLGTGLTTLVAFGVAVATPPLSGPFCKAGCFGYPYLDVAPRFPRDYVWMFPAIVATLIYVAFVLGLQARARPERRLLAQLGVVLSAMAALTIVGDYFLQLAVVQPALLAGEADGVSLLTQYNPHGIFIGLEELGYLLVSASLACMAPALPTSTGLERSVRWVFLGGWLACLAALSWVSARYGHQRAYLFEIAVISIVWLTLIAGAFMMAAVFRHEAGARSRTASAGKPAAA